MVTIPRRINKLIVTLSLSKGDSSPCHESPFDRLRVTMSLFYHIEAAPAAALPIRVSPLPLILQMLPKLCAAGS